MQHILAFNMHQFFKFELTERQKYDHKLVDALRERTSCDQRERGSKSPLMGRYFVFGHFLKVLSDA